MKACLLGLFAVLFISGCSTTSMKGTPFYTGEYEDREGPASDRVNIWPILYYRDPALSVLWPFMEFSPDHLAVRPVYSVYGRESDTPVYNVVWPIARFDTKRKDYRVFPLYWGDDYFTAFPLYWHKGEPLSGKGYDSLFPLWIWNNTGSGTSLHVFWPLYAKHDHAYRQGWHLWPLYGTSDRVNEVHTWWLWPLGHAFEEEGIKGHGFVPFYFRTLEETRSTWVTLPYSRSLSTEPGEKSWDLALPLWYRGWEGNTKSWSVLPALSWGEYAPGTKDNYYALGLIRNAKQADGSAHHVLPFYYTQTNEAGRCFYSLPWWSKSSADGAGWAASFPFYYGSHSPEGTVAITPVYARKKHADGSLAWSCYVPFVYFDRTKDEHYMTLLGGSWSMGDEKRWIALPLLSGGRSDADSGSTLWLAGLGGKKWNAESRSHWVFPLYHSAPAEGRFSSIVYSTWPEGTAQRSMIPILLSGQKVEGDYALRFALLGAWLSENKGDVRTKSQVIPFYAWERDSYFYTALYGRDTKMKYYATPLVGTYQGTDSGSWAWPLYRHKAESDGDIDGRYLLLGSYSKKPKDRHHKFWGIYSFREREFRRKWKKPPDLQHTKRLSYLLLGYDNETETYSIDGDDRVLAKREHKKGFTLLWDKKKDEDVQKEKSEETSSILLALYDSRRENRKDHSYLRRRILWRLWHYEKLNGDSSTDVFPGITVDNYKNGYFKCSLFWRLFRYEKDPASGKKEMDLLFIPVKR